MKARRAALIIGVTAALVVAGAGTCGAATLGNLMDVLEEDKHAAGYDMSLNAPFSKEQSGYHEDISVETGELTLTRDEFVLPGRNGFDLIVRTRYESGAAKLFDENVQATWTGAATGHTNTWGGTVVAYYEVFRTTDDYWLRSDWVQYAAGQTIAGSFVSGSDRWVFSGNLYLESDPGDIIATDDRDNIDFSNTPAEKSAFARARWSLGEGWCFAIPAVEISTVGTGSRFLHLGDGSVYQVNLSSDNGLDGHPLDDLIFTEDDSYDNGTESSAYRLRDKGGTETFFATDGRAIGARDRFGNEIRYYYAADGQGLNKLTSMTDSIGRMVSIVYGTGTVTATAGDRTVTYKKSAIPDYSGKYYLTEITDPAQRRVEFAYSLGGAQFWVYDNAKKTGINRYARLETATFPTGAQSTYAWLESTKNLGAPGKMEYYRVTRRADTLDGDTVNALTYSYHNEPDGYPDYKQPSEIPAGYTYWTTITDQAGLTTEHLYDSRHLCVRRTYTTGGQVARIEESDYDDAFKLPVANTTTYYNARGDALKTYYHCAFDGCGDLLWESSPYDQGDPRFAEQMVRYRYDPTYHLLTWQMSKQDADRTIQVVSTLTLDKKAVAAQAVLDSGLERERTTYTYDAYGNVTSETVRGRFGAPVTTRYEYAAECQCAYLTKKTVADVAGADGGAHDVAVERSSYDFATGRRLTSTDANGQTTSYDYDALGRLTATTLPNGARRTYQYDDASNVIYATDERGFCDVYDFDGLGRLSSVEDEETGIDLVRRQYDAMGRKVKSADGNGHYWTYAYDALGRLTRKERHDRGGALVAATEVAYDDAYRQQWRRVTVTSLGDEAYGTPPTVRTYYYDQAEQLVREGVLTAAGEKHQVYTLDYDANTLAERDFLGNITQYDYDYAGRVVAERRPGGETYRYTYNCLGSRTAMTDPKGHTTLYQVDALGRVVREAAPFDRGSQSVTTRRYDDCGNLLAVVDPAGRTADYSYDEMCRLVRVAAHPDPATVNIARYEFDAAGNLTAMITGLSSDDDPGYSRETYLYDSLSRLVSTTDPLGNTTSYSHDAVGNITCLTDRNGATTTFTYDAMNRLVTRRAAKDGRPDVTTHTYDRAGNRVAMTDPNGETSYRYNELGLPVYERAQGGIEEHMSYDAMGRRTSFSLSRYSRLELDLTYAYDGQGRLAAVSGNGERVTYAYDANGNLTRVANHAGGITEAYYWNDGNLAVAEEIMWGGEALAVYNHDYDPSGCMVRKAAPEGITHYAYDGLGRLSRAEYPDGRTVQYWFDDLGNRTRQLETWGGAAGGAGGACAGPGAARDTTYAYDQAGRLVYSETTCGDARAATSFRYDQNGNQVRKEVRGYDANTPTDGDIWEFHYDGLNRLDGAITPAGERFRYAYNGDDLRVAKSRGDDRLSYAYDGSNVVLEALGDGPRTAVTVRGLRPISRATVAGTQYFTYSARGDVLALYGPDRQQTAQYEYDAFGLELAEPADPFDLEANPFRFNGEQCDPETGFYYLRARFYDPALGRFASEDTWTGEADRLLTLNRFAFGLNSPTKYIDKTGHRDALDAGAGPVPGQPTPIPNPWDQAADSTSLAEKVWDAVGGAVDAAANQLVEAANRFLLAATAAAGAAAGQFVGAPETPLELVERAAGTFLILVCAAVAITDATTQTATQEKTENKGTVTKYHYSYSQFVSYIDAEGLQVGSYLTSRSDYRPDEASDRLSLPKGPPDVVYKVTFPIEWVEKGWLVFLGMVEEDPELGTKGGGDEWIITRRATTGLGVRIEPTPIGSTGTGL